MENFITAGELAKLAETSKRTILFYDKKGILKPAVVSKNGYRYYKESQVLEYQMILLLISIGAKLSEIKEHLSKRGDLLSLFALKQKTIQEDIDNLQFTLNSLNKFVENIKLNGAMVDPVIRTFKPLDVFYIRKTGSYFLIDKYCRQLIGMLSGNPEKMKTMTIFEEGGYKPKKSRMKVCVIVDSGVKVKKEYRDIVSKLRFSPGKVISYMHNGKSTLLSLFWKELEKYCEQRRIRVRKDSSDFEIYHHVDKDQSKQFFEIFLPIY